MANGGIIGTVNTPTSTTATGVWHQQEQYEAKVTDTWPQRALFTTNSARFNDGSTDYLSRTPSSAGSTTTGTFSFWVKRGNVTQDTYIWTSYADGTNWSAIGINNVDQLYFYAESSGSAVANLKTNRVFRDVSAWYHIVVAVDSTDGTADDRIKIYVNGVQETSFVQRTNPSSSADLGISETVAMEIGRYGSGSAYFDGYFSEFIFVDGQALTPTSFGVANSDGVWTPIPYSGTFGTNGFNLQFQNAAALGTDSSSNGNTFTVNNLTSIDQSTDYPVVNFATLNPLNYTSTAIPYSQGNTYGTFPGAWMASLPTIGLTNGKWFWEAKLNSGNDANMFYGVAREGIDLDTSPQNQTGVIVQKNDGDRYVDGSYSAGAAESIASGNTLGVALDLDSGTKTIKFYKNGTLLTSGSSINLTSNFDGYTLFPIFIGNSSSATAEWQTNFGNPAYTISSGNTDGNGYGNFEYAVPSGYYSLNTKNLAEFG